MAIAVARSLPLGGGEARRRIFFSELGGQGQRPVPQAYYGDNRHCVSLRRVYVRVGPSGARSWQFQARGPPMGYSVFSSSATSAAQSGPQVSGGVLAIDACRDGCSAPVPLASGADLPVA